MKKERERESETEREKGREKRKISLVLGPALVQTAQGSSSSGCTCVGLQFMPFLVSLPLLRVGT